VAALHLSPRGRMGAVQDELPGQRLRSEERRVGKECA
jgi:hypothetical protein